MLHLGLKIKPGLAFKHQNLIFNSVLSKGSSLKQPD
jgi:hypothetical protein